MSIMQKKDVKFAVVAGVLCVAVLFVIFLILTERPSQNSNNNSQVDVNAPFTATAKMKFGDIVAVADINRTSPQKFTFSLDEPQSLKDVVISYDGAKVNMSYKGIGVDIDDDSVIAKSLIGIAVSAINSASSASGINVKTQENGLLISGDNENGEFNILLNKDDRSMIQLNVPSLDFECDFSNFIFNDPTATLDTQSTILYSPVD